MMTKTNKNYQQIIDALSHQSDSSDKNMTALLRRITIDDIKIYEEHIINRQYLSIYRDQSHLGTNLCALLFSKVTLLLFSEQHTIEYFLYILIEKHSDEETWVAPKKTRLFKEITGYTHEHHKKRNFVLGKYFDIAYDSFTKSHFYPQTFIDEAILIIENDTSLAPAQEKFYAIYGSLQAGDSFLKFLDQFILDKITELKFTTYLETIIQSFINGLSHLSIYTISSDRLLDYIFGYHWSFSMHMTSYKYSDTRKTPSHLRIHKIILKVIFPYIISGYNSIRQRKFVYDQLNFSDDEIEKYENISKSIDRHESAHYELSLPESSNDIILPNGSGFSQIFTAIEEAFEEYKSYRSTPSKGSFLKRFLHSNQEEMIIKDTKYCLHTPALAAILKHYIDGKIVDLKRYFYEGNKYNQTFDNDIWTIYYPFKENFKYAVIDFTSLPNSFFKKEMKMFAKHYFFHGKSYKSGGLYNVLIDYLNYLHENFNIQKSADIKSDHILMLYHYLEVKRNWKPITIRNRNTSFYAYFEYLLSLNYEGKPISNPLINISLPNAHAHCQKTKSIPEDILTFLDNHIHELRKKDISLMYLLLMETGWRFGDMLALTENCAMPDETSKEIANIWVSSPKTKKHRIKNRLGDVLEDVISIDVYNLLVNYLESTRPIRDAYGITTLFFAITNGVISKYQVSTFNKAINRLCDAYGIKSIDESYWNTSTRQTRKTVATSLISSGASLSAVQKKLGHVSTQTTEKIYAEVQTKKIAELNTEFYMKKFDILMDDDKLKLFTEDERRYLYVDFLLGHRDVELGICTKHTSEGRCALLGYTSCAECPKLCTGKKYLSKWMALANSSNELIQKFEETYALNNISYEDYKHFIEYSQEKKLLNHYYAVIFAIENNCVRSD